MLFAIAFRWTHYSHHTNEMVVFRIILYILCNNRVENQIKIKVLMSLSTKNHDSISLNHKKNMVFHLAIVQNALLLLDGSACEKINVIFDLLDLKMCIFILNHYINQITNI